MEEGKITYWFGGVRSYRSISEAKKAALVKHDIRLWAGKGYRECPWHGDSELGLGENGEVLCEIRCLLNDSFCNPPLGSRCGYEEKEAQNPLDDGWV